MEIAVIGTGNVGGTLARKWAAKGHHVVLGVRDIDGFKGKDQLKHENISVALVKDAVSRSKVIVLATPATAAVSVAQSLGDTTGKIIIDTMNVVNGRGPEGYLDTATAVLEHTQSNELVKCFNTTGFNNMENPDYGGTVIDNFMAGDSESAKKVAQQLSDDIGFSHCHDVGGNDKFFLMEQFANFWINLALFQGQGRDMAFALLKR